MGKSGIHQALKWFLPLNEAQSVHIGDSCYAKYKTCFFPAILRDFVPAQAPSHGKRKRQDDARYKVHVCGEEYDPSKLFARKDVIFIVDGKRFASCKVSRFLGHW